MSAPDPQYEWYLTLWVVVIVVMCAVLLTAVVLM